MYIKHTLSTLFIFACVLAACGSQAATPATPEDQQRAVREILRLGPGLDGVCSLAMYQVECDSQGNVIKLDLSSNKMTNVRLETEQLTKLPPAIGKLTKLQKLIIYGSSLTSLPPEIGQLINLQKLYLVGNPMTSLPPEIGQLINLQELHLSINLTSLPPEIGQLTNLQRLELSNNQLISLPPEIGQLTNLQYLFLNNNPLTNLPPELCAKLKGVEIKPSGLCP